VAGVELLVGGRQRRTVPGLRDRRRDRALQTRWSPDNRRCLVALHHVQHLGCVFGVAFDLGRLALVVR
jgi:hypothetical protein